MYSLPKGTPPALTLVLFGAHTDHSSYPTGRLSLKDMAMQCHHNNNNTWIMKNNISIELVIGRIPAAACADRRLRTPRQQDVSLQCSTCTLMPCHQLRTDPTPSSQRNANSNTAAQVCHLSQTWRSCYLAYWLTQKLLQAIHWSHMSGHRFQQLPLKENRCTSQLCSCYPLIRRRQIHVQPKTLPIQTNLSA